MSTLLLNADFRPHKIVSTNKAICQVLEDKAHVVEEGTKLIRSQHLTIVEPKVIALNDYVWVPPKGDYAVSRKAILVRDDYECQYCGAHATTIDHIIPRSRGGRHTWENVVACCKPCNAKKADKFLYDIGWELTSTPRAPGGTFWILIKARQIDPVWDNYLTQ